MRPEENTLDLNNLPDDYSRDCKQILVEDAFSGCRKKKSGGKEGKEGCGKIYECRFCSLKFGKSQALGGHMNRHRQERETETLNHARQLVFRNDHFTAPHHLGCCQQPGVTGGSYNNVGGDPTMSLRFPTYFSASSSSSSSSHYNNNTSRHYHPLRHYYGGHALHNNHTYVGSTSSTGGESGHKCIGAPVGHRFGRGGGDDGSLLYSHGSNPSVINRFQDEF